MRSSGFKTVIMLAVLAMIAFLPAGLRAVQEIRETHLVHNTIKGSFDKSKRVHRLSHDMLRAAQPFTRERHRAKFRFSPDEGPSREILTISRQLAGEFKTLRGLLSQTPVDDKDYILKGLFETSGSLSVYAKRSLRAIRDGNYALYMASAQGIEKEAKLLSEYVYQIENAVNIAIDMAQESKEDL